MRIIISPAKTLDFSSPPATDKFTQADFLQESRQLIEQLQSLSAQDIARLMKISEKLATLNYQRFQGWSLPLTLKTAKQCLFAFKGDVYTGLDADTFNNKDVEFAQQHLRILSGLYGLLKPLDLVLPYRLEMGTKLSTPKGNNLYQFWGRQLADAINAELINKPQPCVINLASYEYSKALKMNTLQADVITPVFKDMKHGSYKVISFFAKKARGLMSRFIITNRLNNVEGIKDFNLQGYAYAHSLSTDKEWVFIRDETDN